MLKVLSLDAAKDDADKRDGWRVDSFVQGQRNCKPDKSMCHFTKLGHR